jgi:hypothetical protein
MNQNIVIDSQMYHDPNSNVIFHQKAKEHHPIPPALSTNMQFVNSPSSSVRRALLRYGSSSPHLRRILFSSFVLPLFV